MGRVQEDNLACYISRGFISKQIPEIGIELEEELSPFHILKL